MPIYPSLLNRILPISLQLTVSLSQRQTLSWIWCLICLFFTFLSPNIYIHIYIYNTLFNSPCFRTLKNDCMPFAFCSQHDVSAFHPCWFPLLCAIPLYEYVTIHANSRWGTIGSFSRLCAITNNAKINSLHYDSDCTYTKIALGQGCLTELTVRMKMSSI